MAERMDLIAVVEAAYDLEPCDASWLAKLMRTIAPHLDLGDGLMGGIYDASDPEHFGLGCVMQVGGTEELRSAAAAATLAGPPDALRRLYWQAPVFALVSEVIGAPPEPVFSQRVGAPFGVRDMLGFKTLDPSHRGVVMCTAVRSEVRISRRERRTWAMVGAHIAAGLRLRERLLARDARGSSPVEGADAVLEAGGRCVHAAGEARCRGAREALSTALRAIDRARGRRLDPAEALELWQALVSGRWSLVDWLDADGRRYVVARRNDAQVVDPRALSERERQVAAYLALGHGDKLIGYHTGIAASTVSNHVASVRRKLAAGSRTELVALLRGALAQPRPPRERAGRT